MKKWYDGYRVKRIEIYNPRSVVLSITGNDFDSYWTKTETYEALKVYIEMNFDGLKGYSGEVILAGINYDRKEKKHTCVIEKITK